MNRPLNRGTATNAGRFEQWRTKFSGYRNPVTMHILERWLSQFSNKDKDIAARILDAVSFIDNPQIHTCYRELLERLDGWDRVMARRRGRWFFVPFSGSVGESGDSMAHAFRMATSMTNREFHGLFIHRSEIVAKNPGPNDTVVLLDDFSGTGKQACDAWRDLFSELLAGGPRVVLMLVAATQTALERIAGETDMEPVCGTTLGAEENLFGAACSYFSGEEKRSLLRYCKRANRKNPKGFGNTGLVLVFAHRCPNNSIPVLHANHDRWHGLFPRYD